MAQRVGCGEPVGTSILPHGASLEVGEKGGESMRKKTSGRMMMLLGLAMAWLIWTLAPRWTWSQDADKDGFSDAVEMSGITLKSPGVLLDPVTPLSPSKKDLFVIMVPAPGSLIPSNPLEYVSRPKLSGGLDINVHPIGPPEAFPDRVVTSVTSASTQKAIRITEENVSQTGTILGWAFWGVPGGDDDATVWTGRIKGAVYTKCANYTDANCIDADGVTKGKDNITNKYIKHTIAHEAAHMLALTVAYTAQYDGHHYAPASGSIMEQWVGVAVTKKGQVKFSISDKFTATDQAQAIILWP
jgi:hypothetical protein